MPLGGGGGFTAIYWYQIFNLDSVVVKALKLKCSHGSHIATAIIVMEYNQEIPQTADKPMALRKRATQQ